MPARAFYPDIIRLVDQPGAIDGFEIAPMAIEPDGSESRIDDDCDDFEADFWTVLAHIPHMGCDALIDVDTRAEAEACFDDLLSQWEG